MGINGKKNDEDKIRTDLVLPDFIESVAKVLTYGAKKYNVDNWKSVREPRRRYYAALLRHILKWFKGEKIDTESGLSHLAHCGANIMFLMYFDNNKK